MPVHDIEPEAPVRRPRPPGTFRIGSIGDVDVLLRRSWFLLAGLIALLMAPVIDEVEPGLGPWKYVAGLVIAVVYAATILVHEASHAMAARHYDHPVDSVTLHFLGGHTGIESQPRNPREEFVIAVVGPLASLGVALLAWLLHLVSPGGLIGLTILVLAWSNLVLGVFNLIPGLPLDGGRVLKAFVWGGTRNQHRGTIVAGWTGRLTALFCLALPLLLDAWFGITPDLSSWLFAVVLAVFIWGGATAAMQSALIRRRLPDLVARKLARRTVTVPADQPISEAVRLAQEAEAGGIVTLDAQGQPDGIVSEAALLATPEERRPWVPISSVARTLQRGLVLPADISGEDMIRGITFTRADEYLLVEHDGSILGVLSTADVDRAFRERRR